MFRESSMTIPMKPNWRIWSLLRPISCPSRHAIRLASRREPPGHFFQAPYPGGRRPADALLSSVAVGSSETMGFLLGGTWEKTPGGGFRVVPSP